MSAATKLPDADTLFDCCEPRGKARLTYRACLRRQAEIRTIRAAGGKRRDVPVNEFCALKCETGAEVRAMFPGDLPKPRSIGNYGTIHFVPRRHANAAGAPCGDRHPDRPETRTPSRSPLPEMAPGAGARARDPYRRENDSPSNEEMAMPTGYRKDPCPSCGTKGSRHISDCPERGKKAKPTPKAPRVVRPRNGGITEADRAHVIRSASDDELLEELARRIRMVAKIREAIQ